MSLPTTPAPSPAGAPATATTGVTLPKGFRAAGGRAGLKPSGLDDLALVVNDGPHPAAAAVFTCNQIVAAPVTLSREAVAAGEVSAVVINSGNANACTGPQGDADARTVQLSAAERLGRKPGEVAVCSTGIIGEPMPIHLVLDGLGPVAAALDGTPSDAEAAARAVMTTDTVPKQAGATVRSAAGGEFSLGAMGKGAGMLAPSLATMLAVVTTDALVEQNELDAALRAATAQSFERVDVDGATSTNDTVLVMASGASGVRPHPEEFAAALKGVCADLAGQMQLDAEGATKRVTIRVTGAATTEEAVAAARTIGRDTLVKCALFGSDPNWGRVLAAVGMAPVSLDPTGVEVSFNGHPVCRSSAAVPGAREVDLTARDIVVAVDLGVGEAAGEVHTTDLSLGYVEFNSAYTT